MESSSRSPPPSDSKGFPKTSQRQALSCTECMRRKTRCDKQIPCQNCIKRGKESECRLEITVKESAITSRGVNRQILTQIEGLRHSTESTTNELSSRLGHLENLFNSFLRQNPSPGLETAPSEEGEIDPEADAALTLEFLAMGRSRVNNTGSFGRPKEERGEEELWESSRGERRSWSSSTPLTHHPPLPPPHIPHASSSSTSVHPGSRSGSSSRRKGVMTYLPPEEIGRALVKYDMEMVQWHHCAYHAPTFAKECDLFWKEGATGEVEVNKAWLALFYGVLMSALHHMPEQEILSLIPKEHVHPIMKKWFDACLSCLHEADWMGIHTLYSVQCVTILVSPANHLGKADLYFTMLATAIRIAQSLNINHLGADTYPVSRYPPNPNHPPRMQDAQALITREVCKRVFYQLLMQDLFHLPFNRSCVISPSQFDCAPPLRCFDKDLMNPLSLQELSPEIPCFLSHSIQLSKLAIVIHKLFDGYGSKPIPYPRLLQMNDEANNILAEAPSWMRYDNNDQPLPLPANSPPWLEWQRTTYLISSAHKMIILHRPFLGRAFRDPKYQQSRETCVRSASRIILRLKECSFEPFRRSWTVLAHSVAAGVILLMEYAYCKDNQPALLNTPYLNLVLDAIAIFKSVQHHSSIAVKGVTVLSSLLEEQLQKRSPSSLEPTPTPSFAPILNPSKRKATSEVVEMDRAIKMLRQPTSSSSSPHSPFGPFPTGPLPPPAIPLPFPTMYDRPPTAESRPIESSFPVPVQIPFTPIPPDNLAIPSFHFGSELAWFSDQFDFTSLEGLF